MKLVTRNEQIVFLYSPGKVITVQPNRRLRQSKEQTPAFAAQVIVLEDHQGGREWANQIVERLAPIQATSNDAHELPNSTRIHATKRKSTSFVLTHIRHRYRQAGPLFLFGVNGL